MRPKEEYNFFRKYMRKYPTPAEKIARYHLLSYGEKFKWQKRLGPYIADFWIPKYRLCIEIDGGYHKPEKQELYDLRRDYEMKKAGFLVLRVKNEEILQPGSRQWFKEKIEAAVASRRP